MPFGVSNASKRVAESEHPVEELNKSMAGTCGVCGKDESRRVEGGWLPLVPVVIPKEPNGLYKQIMVFTCQVCYAARNRKDFQSLEQFKAYRKAGKGPKFGGLKKAARTSRNVSESQANDFRAMSLKIDAIYDFLIAQGMAPLRVKEQTFSDPYVEAESEAFDDVEFGMTEDQKRRMAEAVAMADARTKEVPKEEWNHENRLQAAQTPDW